MNDTNANRMRELFRRLTTGVAVIAVDGETEPLGMTVNSLTPVSLDPPLLLFCAANQSRTAKVIVRKQAFSVNILTGLQEDVSTHHAGRPLPAPSWTWANSEGVPWIEGANATFICRLDNEYSGGDHRIIVGRIERMFGPDQAETPLLYHGGRYAKLAYDCGDKEARRIEDFWWTG